MAYTDRIRGTESNLAIKDPVRVSTTENIALFGIQTIDGIALVAGDRVLVTSQTNAMMNGIWIAQAAEWYRALDFNGDRDIVQGTQVFVNSGAAAGSYVLTTEVPIIGTTAISFSRDPIRATYRIAEFMDLAGVIAAQVPIGGILQVVMLGSTYTRAPDAATDAHLDYSGTGGLKWYVNQVNGFFRVHDFGVTGLTDDTAAAQRFCDVISSYAVTSGVKAYTSGVNVDWGCGEILLTTTLTMALPAFSKSFGGSFRYIGTTLVAEDPLILITNLGDNYHGKFSDWYDMDLDCGGICSGVKVDGAGRVRLHSLNVHRHMGYAWTNPNSRECHVIDPQISQWTPEYDAAVSGTASAYTADGLRVAYTDTKISGGEIARNKCNVRLLSGSGITHFYKSHIYNQSIGTAGSGTTDDVYNIISELGASDETTFDNCYIDNGAVYLYGDRVNFYDCSWLFNQPLSAFQPTFVTCFANGQASFCRVNITNASIQTFPTDGSCVFIDWVAFGAFTWAQDFTQIKARLAGILTSSQGAAIFNARPAVQELTTYKRNGAVSHFVSAEANAYIGFEDLTTNDATSAPRIGATGNDLILSAPYSTGKVTAGSPLKMMSGNIATITASYPAASFQDCIIIITNGGSSGGRVLCYSDGTNWRRVTDSIIVI